MEIMIFFLGDCFFIGAPCMYTHRGGTIVTMSGNGFDGVADPSITLTVVTTRFNNDTTILSPSTNETDSEVINMLLLPFFQHRITFT